MVKQYKKVFITGDLHLGDQTFRSEEKLVEAIKRDRFDCLVFGGDTFDLWRGQSVEKLVAKYDQLFKFLQNLKSKVLFIRGNHDQEIDSLKRLGFTVKRRFKYIDALGQRIKVIHGHEYDRFCQRAEFFTKKLVWLEERINSFLTKFDQDLALRLRSITNNFDLERMRGALQRRMKYNRHLDALLFGHVHAPYAGERSGIKFFNWGGWQKDFGLNPGFITTDIRGIKFNEVK